METVNTKGIFNRKDLCNHFGISTAQASLDIRQFMKLHPGYLAYNLSEKYYKITNNTNE